MDDPRGLAVRYARRCLDEAEATQNRITSRSVGKYLAQRKADAKPAPSSWSDQWLEITAPAQLRTQVVEAAHALDIALEIANLPETRRRFLLEWSQAESQSESNRFDTAGQRSTLRRFLLPLEASFSPGVPPNVSAQIDTLRFVLRSTARILREWAIVPTREADIQRVMSRQLSTTFPDHVLRPQVPKPLKNFEADGGISSISAAIEFKFASTSDKVAVAVEGISEDLSGYAGSVVWTRFFSVLYQTEPFITEDQFSAALGASGNAGNWEMIVVTGGSGQPADS